MKIYKVVMKGGYSEENQSTYSIEDAEFTYESKWYAAREIAESHIDELMEIKEKYPNKCFGMPRIIEQDVLETKQELKYSQEFTSRSNY